MLPAHQPVLYQEIIHALRPKRGGRYIDGTLGAGGHASGLLSASQPDGQLLGLDVDPQAIELARRTLAPFGERVHIKRGSYTTMATQMAAIGWDAVDGVLLDLGASSMQFDSPQRGFSYQAEGPLDMRFDPESPLTADEIVNRWPERDLAEILYRFGEERAARRIARTIVRSRPVKGTRELAALIAQASPRRLTHPPATQTFQALRIAVNGELEAIEAVLPQAMQVLKRGGRLAMITFHSLEDRLVKEYFRRESKDCLCPPDQPVCTCGHRATLKEVTHRPVRPSEQEIEHNSRAHSAKLRVAEKL